MPTPQELLTQMKPTPRSPETVTVGGSSGEAPPPGTVDPTTASVPGSVAPAPSDSTSTGTTPGASVTGTRTIDPPPPASGGATGPGPAAKVPPVTKAGTTAPGVTPPKAGVKPSTGMKPVVPVGGGGVAVPSAVAGMGATLSEADALEALGAYGDCRPKPFSRCAFFIWGQSKSGKTTVACGLPDTIILDFEPGGGANAVPGKRALVVYVPVWSNDELKPLLEVWNALPPERRVVEPKPNSFMGVREVLRRLARDPQNRYRHIVIDSGEAFQLKVQQSLERGRWRDVYKKTMGELGQTAWKELNSECSLIVDDFQAMGYAVSGIFHLDMEKEGTGSTEKARTGCTPGFVKDFLGGVDFIMSVVRYKKMVNVSDPTKGSVWTHDIRMSTAGLKKEYMVEGGRIALPDVPGASLLDVGLTLQSEYERGAAAYVKLDQSRAADQPASQ